MKILFFLLSIVLLNFRTAFFLPNLLMHDGATYKLIVANVDDDYDDDEGSEDEQENEEIEENA